MLTRAQAFDLNRFVTASPLQGETEPAGSLADTEQSLLDAPSLSIQPRLSWSIWNQGPSHTLSLDRLSRSLSR